jgi:hypothetical protein
MERTGMLCRVLAGGVLSLAVLAVGPAASEAQVTLSADGPGNTYELIESKGFGLETPDCGHKVRQERVRLRQPSRPGQ